MKDYSGRVTEASERLRAQPAILHYKGADNPALRAMPGRVTTVFGVPMRNCLKKKEAVAPFVRVREIPAVRIQPEPGAHTQEKHCAMAQPES